MSEVKKLERDGMVAVLYSPDFGGGWVSWNNTEHAETLAFDAEIVQAVLDGDNDEAAVIAGSEMPWHLHGRVARLEGQMAPEGNSIRNQRVRRQRVHPRHRLEKVSSRLK